MGKREYVRCCGRVRVHVVACVCVCVRAREPHVGKYEQAACPRQHNLARDGKSSQSRLRLSDFSQDA